MKSLFRSLLVVALALNALPSSAQAKGGGKTSYSVPQGILVDTNGKSIGPFQLNGGSPIVFANLNGKLVVIPLQLQYAQPSNSPAALDQRLMVPYGLPNSWIVFENSQCSGPAYISGAMYPGVTLSAVVNFMNGGGEFVYLSSPLSEPVGRNYLSILDYLGRCFESIGFSSSLYPVVEIFNLSALFTVPYRLR